MSLEGMIPTTPGPGSLELFSSPANSLAGVNGSSGQSSSLTPALMTILAEAFAAIMREMQAESQGGSGTSADDAGDPSGGVGPAAQNPLSSGMIPSNLSLDLLDRLGSAGAGQMPDQLPDPAEAGSPGVSGGGASSDQNPVLSSADQTGDKPGAGGGERPVTGGSTVAVDGAKPGGDSVNFQIVNNTGQDEEVALTNSRNQKFSVEDLKPGEKITERLDPNDPNTKSARLQTLNPDGSLKQDAKLTEFNLQPGQTAINVSNNDFAGDFGTDGHAVDPLQMKVSDDQGKEVGDGTVAGPYRVSAGDQTKGPDNPMIMGQDPSKNYTITLGNG